MDAALDLGDLAQAEALRPRLETLRQQARVLTAGAHVYRLTEARLLRYRGELAAARAQFQAYRAEMRMKGDLQQVAYTDLYLGELLLELGEAAEAEPILLELLDLAQRGVALNVNWAVGLLARAYAAQGRMTAALELLAPARAQPLSPADQPYISHAIGEVAARQGQWAEALVGYAAAVEAFAKLEMRWYHAQLLLDWANVFIQRHHPGDLPYARALLREAHALFTTLTVRYYARVTQTELNKLPNP
jgi:tetratricopeptide (TPR) repeat protein